ncbi:hypothetical protein ELG88_14085 [Rhizobium leguminosarum]|uniref:Transmembrane protein n=1 Tax=Rhizobium leguminosarum bv. viciae TaxID=387 RepID=A0A8G2J3S8_RHILV|nr:hypothetical protein [Rhizobium leguminosarum bv. viciae]TBF36263.1 hypothetical protein ELG88_14085 [Rhizobium leguminosarum]NKK19144.1 hypothetical protein [Rhizobium leguminosarum bv. viciae]TBH54629.1 hypothetical protein ELG62_14175 [Rhizobium leguminosarum]TBX97589.1 hypothetical protein E0H31_01395 [Rhizobium leguminosarum bv. viciae]
MSAFKAAAPLATTTIFISRSSDPLAPQSFALLGTLVGIGPQTTLDYITHAVMMLLLVTGLVWLARNRNASPLG